MDQAIEHCTRGAGIWDWAGTDDGTSDPDIVLACACAGDVNDIDVDVVFSFHGYPGAVHQLVHGRPDADRFRVRGFIEQGTTTTPFDMMVRNQASRYHLVMDAINNARRLPRGATELKAWCQTQLAKHEAYIVENLEDMPEVRDWTLADRQQPS